MKQTNPYIIVVGVDFEPDGDLAIDEAIRIAAAHGNAEVHILHVAKSMPSTAEPTEVEAAGVSPRTTPHMTVLDRLESLAEARIEAAQEAAPGLYFNRIVTHFRIGKAAQMLVQLAVDLDADLIVVGTHNRTGLKRLVLGSVAETVARQARCPVQVVRAKDHLDLGDIPEIEPPCDACLEVRAATDGAEIWCARHALAKFRPRIHPVIRGGARGGQPEPWSQSTPQV